VTTGSGGAQTGVVSGAEAMEDGLLVTGGKATLEAPLAQSA